MINEIKKKIGCRAAKKCLFMYDDELEDRNYTESHIKSYT